MLKVDHVTKYYDDGQITWGYYKVPKTVKKSVYLHAYYVPHLDKYEVKEIECLGQEFDPNVSEAVLTEHDENKPANVVLEVLTKGYKYKDKLIRPAMVKVNK